MLSLEAPNPLILCPEAPVCWIVPLGTLLLFALAMLTIYMGIGKRSKN
jgi:hypothetical protein